MVDVKDLIERLRDTHPRNSGYAENANEAAEALSRLSGERDELADLPAESRDGLANDLEHAASVADLDGLDQWSPVFRSAAKRITELEAELQDSQRRFFTDNPYAAHNAVLQARAETAERQRDEAIERAARLDEVARTATKYFLGYVQDEAASREDCISDSQHEDAKALESAIRALKPGT